MRLTPSSEVEEAVQEALPEELRSHQKRQAYTLEGQRRERERESISRSSRLATTTETLAKLEKGTPRISKGASRRRLGECAAERRGARPACTRVLDREKTNKFFSFAARVPRARFDAGLWCVNLSARGASAGEEPASNTHGTDVRCRQRELRYTFFQSHRFGYRSFQRTLESSTGLRRYLLNTLHTVPSRASFTSLPTTLKHLT